MMALWDTLVKTVTAVGQRLGNLDARPEQRDITPHH